MVHSKAEWQKAKAFQKRYNLNSVYIPYDLQSLLTTFERLANKETLTIFNKSNNYYIVNSNNSDSEKFKDIKGMTIFSINN